MSQATRCPAVGPDGAARAAGVAGTAAGPPGLASDPAGSDPQRLRQRGWELAVRFVQTVLFVTLVGSAVYTAAHLSSVPPTSADPSVRVRSDYLLMFIQCVGGLIVMFLPAVARRWWAVPLPSVLRVGYLAFLYAAIYLGEVRGFYYRFAFWDGALHFLSGIMLGALGFLLVVHLANPADRGRSLLSPVAIAFLAFCFAVACGTIWEIYEFTIDGLFGTNMQKVVTGTGQLLIGRDALADTMTDLILDTTAALAVAILGYLRLRRGQLTGESPSRPVAGVLRPQ